MNFFKLFLAGSFLLIACNKENKTSIDVSKQWQIDNSGTLISGLPDGQWENRTFTTQEQSLFNTFDTVSLSGTIKPDSVFEEKPLSRNFPSPNPFKQSNQLSFSFTNGYSGQLVLKYVIVNSGLSIMDKGAIKIQATACSTCPINISTSGIIRFNPNIPSGKFRLYYTLSAQSNPDFYKTWGNIQKN